MLDGTCPQPIALDRYAGGATVPAVGRKLRRTCATL